MNMKAANLKEAVKQNLITWPDYFRLMEGVNMETNEPTGPHHETRLAEARQELKTLQELEAVLIKNIKSVLEAREFSLLPELASKLADNEIAVFFTEKTIKMIQDDIDLDKRQGIY
jgi:hypothetical protein